VELASDVGYAAISANSDSFRLRSHARVDGSAFADLDLDRVVGEGNATFEVDFAIGGVGGPVDLVIDPDLVTSHETIGDTSNFNHTRTSAIRLGRDAAAFGFLEAPRAVRLQSGVRYNMRIFLTAHASTNEAAGSSTATTTLGLRLCASLPSAGLCPPLGDATECTCATAREIVLRPAHSVNAPGQDHSVTAELSDLMGVPLSDVQVAFDVVSGPNAGAAGICTDSIGSPAAECASDAAGTVNFTYTSDGRTGADEIIASFADAIGNAVGSETAFKFWDTDCNQNGIADTCDLDCDGFDSLCGEGPGCGASNDANGDDVPDECNRPPDCANAGAEPDALWPPSHAFKEISIAGVTDEDGDPIEIEITGIVQDEPVEAEADGQTSPDAEGVGGDVASVRAEREGSGDGRVYRIRFDASDEHGDGCTGEVTVCVPRDQHPGPECGDQGPLFDSTVEHGTGRIACGIGYELSLLLAPLLRLRRRRGHRG
jgi:hypothetical protein